MTTIAVKPHPDVIEAAWPLLVHPVSGGLLDAAQEVPADGRPWLNDGFTARMLTDGAILRADHPIYAERAAAEEKTKAEADAEAARAADTPPAAPDPAH